MTQAEFRQAAATGSLPLKAQNWFAQTLTGKLAPELEKMMFADIQRSYETSRDQSKKLRDRIATSSNAPQVPSSSSADDDLKKRLLEATH